MQLEIAKRIVEAGENLGLGLSLRDNYSGRGMMGEKTTGVVVKDLFQFGAAVAEAAKSDAFITLDIQLADEIISECLKARSDSLGRELIVY